MTVTVSQFPAPFTASAVVDLAELITATVNEGAAISFMQPYTPAEGAEFWRKIETRVADGATRLFVAERDGKFVGTVQLIVEMPPNQPHRAEIAKMMVHPDARRLGIGKALLTTALDEAAALGKKLVCLDTRTGDKAEGLYKSLGFETAGTVPDFAYDPDGGALHATTYMYRRL